MPGITLIFDRSGNGFKKENTVRESINKLSIHKDFTSERVFGNERIIVYLTSHEYYPVRIADNPLYYFIVEGRIYNYSRSQTDNAIKNILEGLNNKQERISDIMGKFFKDADGDFLVFAINKKNGDFFLINDALSRLPVYIYETDKFSVLTREIGVAADLAGSVFDTYALTQYLITGYPWGDSTLFKNIKYLPGASVLVYSAERLKIVQYADYNFENVVPVDAKEAAGNAADLFLSSVSNRIKDHQGYLLSLSGGLDSRAVLAACKKINMELPSASYLDFEKFSFPDVLVAEELASAFNSSLELIELSPAPGRYFSDLLKIKRGLNYLGMSFILGFFEHVRKRSPNYVTGDGGDKLFPDIRPERNLKSGNALLDYVLRHHGVFNLKTASVISGLRVEVIKEYLITHFENYPEKSFNNKYIRFMNFERAGNWLFEGEDRNRYFFWSIAPFYSIHLFNYCTGIPGDLKSGYNFFRNFLHIIAPDLNYINNANWGFSLASPKLRNYLYLNRLKARIPVVFKNTVKSMSPAENILKKKRTVPLTEVFLKQQLHVNKNDLNIDWQYLYKLKTFNRDQFYYLFTLLSVTEYKNMGQSTISDYDFKDFEFFS